VTDSDPGLVPVRFMRTQDYSYFCTSHKIVFFFDHQVSGWRASESSLKNEDRQKTPLWAAGVTRTTFATRKQAVEACALTLGEKTLSFTRSVPRSHWASEDGFFAFCRGDQRSKPWFISLTRRGLSHFGINSNNEASWQRSNGLDKSFKTLKAARQAVSKIEILEGKSV
jgi:hypothetical protein